MEYRYAAFLAETMGARISGPHNVFSEDDVISEFARLSEDRLYAHFEMRSLAWIHYFGTKIRIHDPDDGDKLYNTFTTRLRDYFGDKDARRKTLWESYKKSYSGTPKDRKDDVEMPARAPVLFLSLADVNEIISSMKDRSFPGLGSKSGEEEEWRIRLPNETELPYIVTNIRSRDHLDIAKSDSGEDGFTTGLNWRSDQRQCLVPLKSKAFSEGLAFRLVLVREKSPAQETWNTQTGGASSSENVVSKKDTAINNINEDDSINKIYEALYGKDFWSNNKFISLYGKRQSIEDALGKHDFWHKEFLRKVFYAGNHYTNDQDVSDSELINEMLVFLEENKD
jgi:hypothetical protein